MYPNRVAHDGKLRAQGQTSLPRLNMVYSPTGEIPGDWKGTELLLPADAVQYYLTSMDLTAQYRCLGSSSLSSPTCTGEGCIPCYSAQLRRLHANAGAEWF